jgi:hypothetical protein
LISMVSSRQGNHILDVCAIGGATVSFLVPVLFNSYELQS